jgi:hypothetical protein
MNRADLMRHTLRSGDWRSRHEIFRDAGQFFLTNNAASELRARGFTVEQRRKRGEFQYRIAEPLLPSSSAQRPAGDSDRSFPKVDVAGTDGLTSIPQGVTPAGPPSQLSLGSASPAEWVTPLSESRAA